METCKGKHSNTKIRAHTHEPPHMRAHAHTISLSYNHQLHLDEIYLFTRIRINIRMYLRKYSLVFTHLFMHAYIHACTNKYIHACMHCPCMHACMHATMHATMHASIHKHIHIHMAYMHTYTKTNKHTDIHQNTKHTWGYAQGRQLPHLFLLCVVQAWSLYAWPYIVHKQQGSLVCACCRHRGYTCANKLCAHTYQQIVHTICWHVQPNADRVQPNADRVAKNLEIILNLCQRTRILPTGFTISTT